MNKVNWSSLLPEEENNYTGSKISLIFLIVWATFGIVRGSIYGFAREGGASWIAGFDLTNTGAAELILIFGALRSSQLVYSFFNGS